MELKEPKQCTKFIGCNANLCPIDPELHLRKYYGEAICFYVRQYIKIKSGMADASKLKEVELIILEAVLKNIALMKRIGGAKYRYKLNRASKHKSKSQVEHLRGLDHTNLRGPITINEGSHNEEMEVA